MNNNEQKIDPIIWAVVFLAVIVAIVTIAVTADAKKERYLIDNPGTPVSAPANSANREIGDPRAITNGGKANDQETKRRMVFPDSHNTANCGTDVLVFQNGDRRIQPAGDSEGAAGHKKHGVGTTDTTDAVKTAKSGSVRLTAESSKEDFRRN